MGNIYKEGINRKQQIFFPPSIDEYVSKDNQARAIEDYVELLDTAELGFTNASLNSADGQPAYHPRLLLKIYIYGYLNKVRSSRKLEQEIDRNIEMMWLCAGLKPRYKTIANFRKDNTASLKKVFREFVLLCRDLELIEGKLLAVDGAFLRANASKNQLITKKFVKQNLEKIDKKIEEYLQALSFSDKEEKKDRALKPLPTNNLPRMKLKKEKLDKDLALLEEMGVTQYNRTDPDAQLMSKPAHNLMAYNAQIVVDDKFKFIVAIDISSEGNDSHQLHHMAKQAKEIVQNDELVVTGDKGYFNAEEIKKCIDDGIDTVVPKTNTGQVQGAKGKFGKDRFTYDKLSGSYICPGNHHLIFTGAITKRGDKVYHNYRVSNKICKSCPLKEQCLSKTKSKTILRYKYADVIDEYKEKMETDESKNIIKKRGSIVEHPFGTTKQNLGWSHYLVRGTQKVSGENALIMFSYNFRRLLNLIGTTLFRKLIIAIKEGNMDAIREEIAAYIAHLWYIWVNLVLKFWKMMFLRRKLGNNLDDVGLRVCFCTVSTASASSECLA